MPSLKYCLVKGLAWACELTHPLQFLPVTRNYAYCMLAGWSASLEDRWETGAWEDMGAKRGYPV